jgi:hypothetical protein
VVGGSGVQGAVAVVECAFKASIVNLIGNAVAGRVSLHEPCPSGARGIQQEMQVEAKKERQGAGRLVGSDCPVCLEGSLTRHASQMTLG